MHHPTTALNTYYFYVPLNGMLGKIHGFCVSGGLLVGFTGRGIGTDRLAETACSSNMSYSFCGPQGMVDGRCKVYLKFMVKFLAYI